jgi:hypothetical protein
LSGLCPSYACLFLCCSRLSSASRASSWKSG